MSASLEGHLEAVRALVLAGADMNRKNLVNSHKILFCFHQHFPYIVQDGEYALELAVQRGHTDIALFLIKSGAQLQSNV